MSQELEISLTDPELVDEVRDAMAGLDGTNVPEGTITQTADRFVEPLLNDIAPHLKPSEDQEAFDSAAIAFTAELSFDAWLAFTRVRDREVETYVNPENYRKQLRKRTNLSLRLVDATRPSEIPNYHVTVNKDGVNERVNLQKYWVPEQ